MLIALTEIRTGEAVYLHPMSISLLKPLYDDRHMPIGSKIFVINYGYWLEVNELPHEIIDSGGTLKFYIEQVKDAEQRRKERRAALRRGEMPPPSTSGPMYYD